MLAGIKFLVEKLFPIHMIYGKKNRERERRHTINWDTYCQWKVTELNVGLHSPRPSSPSSVGDHPAASAWNPVSWPSGNVRLSICNFFYKTKAQSLLVSFFAQANLDGREGKRKRWMFHSSKLMGIYLSLCFLLPFSRVVWGGLSPLSLNSLGNFLFIYSVKCDVKAISNLVTGAVWVHEVHPFLSKASVWSGKAASVPSQRFDRATPTPTHTTPFFMVASLVKDRRCEALWELAVRDPPCLHLQVLS